MRPLIQLFALCIGSLAVYALATFAIEKPLTVSVIHEMIEFKIKAAERAQPPRIFVLAGSNGRFSHSAGVLGQELGMPAVNLSIAAGIGLDYVFAKYDPLFKEGDIVYLPLEYPQYTFTRDRTFSGPENALLARQDRALLQKLEPMRAVRAFFAKDISFMIQGSAEMALNARGISRRFGVHTLTPDGDETGHTLAKRAAYAEALEKAVWTPPDPGEMAGPTYARNLIAQAMNRLSQRGVIVLGGLPTTFDDAPISEDVIAAIRQFWISEIGSQFVALPNNSQYPRGAFYDTPYHLAEEFQQAHSRELAGEIKRILRDARPLRAIPEAQRN